MALTPPPPPPMTDVATPSAARRQGVPGIVALLGLGAVIIIRFTVSVGPWLGGTPPNLSGFVNLVLTFLPFAAYVALVAVVARGAGRRLASTAVAGAALPVHVVFWFVLTRSPRSVGDIERLQLVGWIEAGLVGLLLVAAWGIARRTGPAWWLGLVAVPLLVTGQALVNDGFAHQLWDLSTSVDWPGATWAIVVQISAWTIWNLIPPLVAGTTCWLVDVLAPGPRDQGF